MASVQEVLDSIWVRYDFDKNGTLNSEEAEQLYLDISANRPDLGLTADGYQAWFAGIDADGDKTINRAEL